MRKTERGPTVDANLNIVLPREIAETVMAPTTLASRNLVRDVGKELPRVGPIVFLPFRVGGP